MEFLSETFPALQGLRPGRWHIAKLGNNSSVKTSDFVQYEHLEYLWQTTRNDAQLAACIGNDYMVAPDVVIYREPEDDASINKAVERLVTFAMNPISAGPVKSPA